MLKPATIKMLSRDEPMSQMVTIDIRTAASNDGNRSLLPSPGAAPLLAERLQQIIIMLGKMLYQLELQM